MSMEQVNALEEVKRFCQTFGGRPVVEYDTFYHCDISRPLSYTDFSKILASLMSNNMKTVLSNILKNYLYSFEINFRTVDGMSVSIKIDGSNTSIIHVDVDTVKQYDIPLSKIEYIYPDAIEDYEYLFGREVEIVGHARGIKHDGKLAAYIHITTLIYANTLTPEDANRIIEEIKDIRESLESNPRNFAKLK